MDNSPNASPENHHGLILIAGAAMSADASSTRWKAADTASVASPAIPNRCANA